VPRAPMRIVLVFQHFQIDGAGSSKPADLATYLAGRGHDVTVICARRGVEAAADLPPGRVARGHYQGLRLIAIEVPYAQGMRFVRRLWSFFVFAAWACWALLRLPAYDVLLASSTPLTVGFVGLLSRYVRRRPWVFELRDLWPEAPWLDGWIPSRRLYEIATRLEEGFYREAHAICAIS